MIKITEAAPGEVKPDGPKIKDVQRVITHLQIMTTWSRFNAGNFSEKECRKIEIWCEEALKLIRELTGIS